MIIGDIFTPYTDAHQALPPPPFGKSDHNSILRIPADKQKLKQEAPVTRSIKKWSDELNYIYAHFEASNTETCMRASNVPDDFVITLSAANVR